MVRGNLRRASLSPHESGGELQGLVAGAGVREMYLGAMTPKLYSYSNIENQDRNFRLESSYPISLGIRKSVLSIDSRICRMIACMSRGCNKSGWRVSPIL